MAVFTQVGLLLKLNLLSGPRFGAIFVPAPEKKGAHFGRELFSETFRLGVNTQPNLTVNKKLFSAYTRAIFDCVVSKPTIF